MTPMKGDVVIVSDRIAVNSNGKLTKQKTKPLGLVVDAVYEDGTIRDSVGDVWQVVSEGTRRWRAVQ